MAIRVAQGVLSKSGYYEFHSKGDLHRNVLLNTLEDMGITFRDYDLSPTGIKAKNSKTEKVLSRLFKAANAPRPGCIYCVRKHIGQASACLQESLQGYPEHRDLAIGHLAEAEAEAQALCPDFAGKLRNVRIKLERTGEMPDCVGLLRETYGLGEGFGGPCENMPSKVAATFLAWGREEETYRSRAYVEEFAKDMMSAIKTRYFKFEAPWISPYGGQVFTVKGISRDGATGISLYVEFGTRTAKNYLGIGIGDPGRASGERQGRFANGEYPTDKGYKPAARWFNNMIKKAEEKRLAERRTFTKEEMLKEIGAKPGHPVEKNFEISDDGLDITVKDGSMTTGGPINSGRGGWQEWVKMLKKVKRQVDRQLTQDSLTGIGMNRAKRKKLFDDLKRKNRGKLPMSGEIEWENSRGTKIRTTWEFRQERGVEYDDYVSDEIVKTLDSHLQDLDSFFQATHGFSSLRNKDWENAGMLVHESEALSYGEY